jgi:Ca2+-binding RTX toxin-like protein
LDGNDQIDGGAGDDSVRAGEGDGAISFTGGHDTIFADGGDDIVSSSSILTVYGGSGNDSISQGYLYDRSTQNVIFGGNGDDNVDIEVAVASEIFGGAGNDTILLSHFFAFEGEKVGHFSSLV